MLTVINPATEETIAEVPEASIEDVRRAIDAARRAFDEGPWPRMTVRQRSAVMHRMGLIMQSRRSELIGLNVSEAGATRILADFQVRTPIEHWLDMSDRVLPQFAFDQAMLPKAGKMGLGQGVVVREPIGVTSLITAFTFPFLLNVFELAPALAAGCTTVLKSSPYTPLEALILGEIADEAELPSGVLNIVTGDIEADAELTTNAKIDAVSFTGSDMVGRRIYAQASETRKKVILEVGGKSTNIVCDDADLDRVAVDVVGQFTHHAGQGCGLLTRTLVHQSLHDELIVRMKVALDFVKVGDPADPSVTMGPLIRPAQRDKVETLIRIGIQEGAELAYGGGRPAHLDKGFFVEPTLFVNVDNSMAIAQRASFGPVGVVIPFHTDEEAVALANSSDHGPCGVWSADASRAYGLARQLRTGRVWIGGGGGLKPEAPWGGYNQSGLGREFGAAGLSEFLQAKRITWRIA